MKTQPFLVGRLGGMDERWKPGPHRARVVRDMTWDPRHGWKSAGGYGYLVAADDQGERTNGFTGEGKIASMHWFSQHNGARQWLLYETSGGALKYFDPSSPPGTAILDESGNAITRTIVDGPWQGTQSQTWGNGIYLVNGYDEPLFFNGRVATRAGFDSAPGPPDPSAMTGSDTTLKMIGLGYPAFVDSSDEEVGKESAYRYKVSFVNERGQESPLSAASQTVTFTPSLGARAIVRLNLPVGGDNVVARRVYRTRDIYDSDGEPTNLGYAEEFYLIATVPDNITTSWEDLTPDSSLGSLVNEDNYGTFPSSVKYLASFKNRLFAAGMSGNEIRYSAPLSPERFPANNVLRIGDGDMGPITGMYVTKNALVIFKPRGVYLIKSFVLSGAVEFSARTLTGDVGCIAPGTILEIPGVGLSFLSHKGVYVLQGALESESDKTGFVHLSEPIPNQVDRINTSAAIGAKAAVYHRDKEVWFCVPTIGSAVNNRVLVFHYEVGEWSFRTGFPVSSIIETRDHRGYLMFGSHDDSGDQEGIHYYSHGFPDKGGVAIVPLYESVDIDFGSVYSAIQPKHIVAYAVGYGDNDLSLNYAVNRNYADVLTASKVADQQDPNRRYDVWGTVKWGAGTWASHDPVTVRFDVSATHKGPVREIRVAFSPAATRMQLVGYEISTAVGEQRKIKSLTEALNPGSR